ncbi:hypothetical protein [Vibrio sp. MMH1-50]|uniref:hypothetical protein n=1 Tax=Vibrio sp. MMH1-50 TaxID=2917764 RepID=UPI001EF2D2FF|nr:hypothetical protein [Vibrio sp. MMH1-50]MCG7517951.1 hypothetical protein [Vibrio sp. MMH1-50]
MSKDISLIETLKKSDLGSVSTELAEIAIDGVLTEGVLKDIPVVNTLIATYKAGQSVRDNLFNRKLLRFLNEVSDIPPLERAEVISKLESSPGDVGEMLLLSLDRLDNLVKPELLAKAFLLLANDEVSVKEFYDLKTIIENINMNDVEEIKKFYEDYLYCPNELISSLLQTKLAAINEGGIMDHAHPLFKTTKIGRTFLTKVANIELNIKKYT